MSSEPERPDAVPAADTWLKGHPVLDPQYPPPASDVGAWLSGAMSYSAGPTFAGEHDEYTGDTTVGEAVAALRAFGADLTRERATALIRMWRGYRELTSRERIGVLLRFPRIGDRTRCQHCDTTIERTRDDALPWRHINQDATCETPAPCEVTEWQQPTCSQPCSCSWASAWPAALDYSRGG